MQVPDWANACAQSRLELWALCQAFCRIPLQAEADARLLLLP